MERDYGSAIIKGEANKKSKNFWIVIIGISCYALATIITFVCTSGYYISEINKKESNNTTIIQNKDTLIDAKNQEVTALTTELEECKQSIYESEPNEQLIHDIAQYIHSNFPIIPKVLYNEIAMQIATLSRQENVPPELIVGITQVESSFNPMAISSKNARGLMQVMPAWAKHFKLNKVCDLHNVSTGIHIGIKVFKIHVKEEKGDVSEGLYKYVNRDRSYVDRVYNAMGQFVMFRSQTDEIKGETNDTDCTAKAADSGSTGNSKG